MAFNPDEYLQKKSEVKKGGFDPDSYLAAKNAPSEAGSGIRGAISGITAGFDDEITGGLGAIGRVFGVKNLGSAKPFDPNSHYEMASEPLSFDEIVKAYRENRDAQRNDQKLDMETNPKATIAGNVVGSIASPVNKIIPGAGVSKLANAIKTSATQGAIYGAGASGSDLTKGEVGKFATDTALGAGIGAVVPPALKVTGAAVKGGANAVKFAAKKGFQSVFNNTESNISKYLANSERINGAKTLGEIKDLVDETVGKLRDDVDAGKITESEAKEALRGVKEQVTRGLSDKKVDSKDALRTAESMFNDARDRAIAPIKNVKAPTDRAADASAMVAELKQKVVDLSSKARSELSDSDSIDLKSTLDKIRSLSDEMRGNGSIEGQGMADRLDKYANNLIELSNNKGAVKIAPKAKSVIQENDFNFGENVAPKRQSSMPLGKRASGPTENLDYVPTKKLQQMIKDNGINPDTGYEIVPEEAFKVIARRSDKAGEKLVNEYEKELAKKSIGMEDLPQDIIDGLHSVSGQKAKDIIQGLDPLSKYNLTAGTFDQGLSKAYKQIRRELDQALKDQSPRYREAMRPVAENASLLENASSAFGSPEIAVGKLGRLNTPRGEFDRATLNQLEQATGKQGLITKEADLYAQAQKVLKDPQAIAKIEQSLPEYQTLRQAMADVAKRNPKWTRVQIEQATARQRKDLAEATSRRIFSEEKLAPFKALSQSSTENKINALMRNESKGINNREVFERLGKESGNDFLQMADDLAVKNSFEKGATNGSRNTVMGAVIGFAVGGVYGAGAGATIGHTVMDKYGPMVGKKILDGIIKIRKNPSIQTIRGLEVPEGVKQELEREFKVFMIMKNSGESAASRVAGSDSKVNRSPAKGEELWMQKGAEKLGIDSEKVTSKQGKQLLIEASDLPPDSKRLKMIKQQLQGMEK